METWEFPETNEARGAQQKGPPSRGGFLIAVGTILGIVAGICFVGTILCMNQNSYWRFHNLSDVEEVGEKVRDAIWLCGSGATFLLSWMTAGVGYCVRYLARLAYDLPAAAELSAACCKCGDSYPPGDMHKLKDGRYLCAACREQILANRKGVKPA